MLVKLRMPARKRTRACTHACAHARAHADSHACTHACRVRGDWTAGVFDSRYAFECVFSEFLQIAVFVYTIAFVSCDFFTHLHVCYASQNVSTKRLHKTFPQNVSTKRFHKTFPQNVSHPTCFTRSHFTPWILGTDS